MEGPAETLEAKPASGTENNSEQKERIKEKGDETSPVPN